MKAWVILSFLVMVGCGSSPTPPATVETPVQQGPEIAAKVVDTSDRAQINGVWQLVSFEQNESDGNVSRPYGDMPVGRLTLDAAGRLSVVVMKLGRVASVNSTAAIATASAEDLRQIADGFMAYYGSFEVDDSTKTLTTKVEACTIPAWTGSEQKRTYELAGDMLTLITPATRLTWTRLPN